jgi:hypothetical protein
VAPPPSGNAPGTEYLARKRAQELAAGEACAQAHFQAQRTLELVTGCAEEIQLKPVAARQPKPAPQLVLNAVCLLAESRFADFQRQVEEAGKGLAGSGFHLEVSGPWPPYHFSTKVEDDVIPV